MEVGEEEEEVVEEEIEVAEEEEVQMPLPQQARMDKSRKGVTMPEAVGSRNKKFSG
jgi:hypothetical protein